MPTWNSGNGEAYRWLMESLSYDGDECLTWPFSTNRGYGQFGHMGNTYKAHRYICEIIHGPAPTAAHLACHSCGRGHKGCVTKRHILWKTPRENQLDRRIHGTQHGAKGARTNLTLEQIQDIRDSQGVEKNADVIRRLGITRGVLEYWRRIKRDPRPAGTSRGAIDRRKRKNV